MCSSSTTHMQYTNSFLCRFLAMTRAVLSCILVAYLAVQLGVLYNGDISVAQNVEILLSGKFRDRIPTIPHDRSSPELDRTRDLFGYSLPQVITDVEVTTRDHRVPVSDGETILARSYRPAGLEESEHTAGVVYFHGGGWVFLSVGTHDKLARSIVKSCNCTVVSVDYRLAPEYKFPTPLNDCFSAVKWVAAHADELGVDLARLTVGGDSAGGNLATAVTQMARDAGAPQLAAQLLIYPVTEYGVIRPSRVLKADGFGLTDTIMAWFWLCYLRSPEDGVNPLASPMHSKSLEGLPPALIIVAEHDVLRDEAVAYGAALQQASTPAVVHEMAGQLHGFLGRRSTPESVRQEACRLIGETLMSL